MAYQQKLKHKSNLKSCRMKSEYDTNSDDHRENQLQAVSQKNKEINRRLKLSQNQCEQLKANNMKLLKAIKANESQLKSCRNAVTKEYEEKLSKQIKQSKANITQKDKTIEVLKHKINAKQRDMDQKEKEYTDKIQNLKVLLDSKQAELTQKQNDMEHGLKLHKEAM
eukprot:712204_1